jgi:serine/threonine protein kinase
MTESDAAAVESGPRFQSGELISPGLFAWERLGAGTRTECWLAWSLPLWSHVVVKLPRQDQMGEARAAGRLEHEARLLRRLAHPGIQRLLEDRHRDPVPHLVLEYVEGPTLALLLEEQGPLDPGDVVRLGLQLAACLHHVHGMGLVHLDLKPGNVALGDGRAVLLDFDIARPVGSPGPPGRPHGTRAHMAPEQCLRARADPGMDLFALGTVLYELAAGQPAFARDPGCEFPQLVVAPARARGLRRCLPASVDAAIHALLERDASRRPRTALETLRLLAAALPSGEEATWPGFVDGLLESEAVRDRPPACPAVRGISSSSHRRHRAVAGSWRQ